MTKILKLEKVCKSYGSIVALAPTDLDVGEGEFVTLLGPSGSGKTTLLMIVAGLIQPDGGEIWINGNRATYAPPHARGIGMVFQNYALFPHLTIFENIAFALRMRRRPEAEIKREVARVLDIVQLPDVADRFPHALSGGQQQRIALARCIVFQPSIILMDEPLGALDKKLREQLQLEIKHLHAQLGTTILYVTHDQQETLTMSDRICLMNQGSIVQLGTPEELYFSPRTIFAADFLGESNILKATITDVGAKVITLCCDDVPGGLIKVPPLPTNTGKRVNVMIRPERITLGGDDEKMNSLAGVVSEIIFSGNITKCYVTLEGGRKMSATFLTMPSGDAPRIGDHVKMSWPIEGTVVLPIQDKDDKP